MNKLFVSVLTVLLFTLAGCEKDDNFVEPKEFTFNFMNSAEVGWETLRIIQMTQVWKTFMNWSFHMLRYQVL